MERLQKVLAQAGIASRRAAEEIILAGRVRVDGKIVRELGTQVDPRTNRVEVDGNKIVAEKLIYIVLHKPRGVVCTLSDPEGRPTILELLKDAGARVVPVGRLDFHTSGALICTNDGEFAQALAHPTKKVPKVYVAKVKGAVDDEALDKFSERIVIDGRPTQPAQVKRLRFEGDKTWLEITLREGRNRQVRRLGEATGFPVMRLARVSHAGVSSEELRPGQWRPLSVEELVELKREFGVPKKVRAPLFEPALGKAGWSDEPRTPGARRPEPKFSAARRRDAKPRDAKRHGAHRGESNRAEAAVQPARFDRRRTPPRQDEAPLAERGPVNARRRENNRPTPESAEPPRFDRTRSAPRREEATRGEPKRLDAKRSAPRREEATRGEPKRFEGKGRAPRRDEAPAVAAKPFNAAHREKKRFNAKNAEPKAFEPKRPRAPGTKAPFDAKRARSAGPKPPFDAKRAPRSSSEAPFRSEPGQSPSRTNPNRPWEARSRATSERRPATSSARPSADRTDARKDRGTGPANYGGERGKTESRPSERKPYPSPRGRSDARGSGPRRGTSR